MEKPELQLTGIDGNAFMILGTARRALLKAGYSQADVDRYMEEAKSGDYDHLLQVTMKWFDVS